LQGGKKDNSVKGEKWHAKPRLQATDNAPIKGALGKKKIISKK